MNATVIDRFTYDSVLYHVTPSPHGGYRVIDPTTGIVVTDGRDTPTQAREDALTDFRTFDNAMGGTL